MNCCIHPAPHVWPLPIWIGPDPELERLRRLEQAAVREAEKEAIRRRLRQQGVPEDQIQGGGFPPAFLPAFRPRLPSVPSLEEVLKRIR